MRLSTAPKTNMVIGFSSGVWAEPSWLKGGARSGFLAKVPEHLGLSQNAAHQNLRVSLRLLFKTTPKGYPPKQVTCIPLSLLAGALRTQITELLAVQWGEGLDS